MPLVNQYIDECSSLDFEATDTEESSDDDSSDDDDDDDSSDDDDADDDDADDDTAAETEEKTAYYFVYETTDNLYVYIYEDEKVLNHNIFLKEHPSDDINKASEIFEIKYEKEFKLEGNIRQEIQNKYPDSNFNFESGFTTSPDKEVTFGSKTYYYTKITFAVNADSSTEDDATDDDGDDDTTTAHFFIKDNSFLDGLQSESKDDDEFLFGSFHQELKVKTEDEFLYSPYSLAEGLGMLYLGVNDNNEQHDRTKLQTDLNFFDRMHSTIKNLRSDYKNEFNIVNHIFLRNTFNPNKEYINYIKKYYEAGIEEKDEITANVVNDFVADRTNNLIPETFTSLNNPAMVLLNLIYLKKGWKYPFETYSSDPNIKKIKLEASISGEEFTYSLPMTKDNKFDDFKDLLPDDIKNLDSKGIKVTGDLSDIEYYYKKLPDTDTDTDSISFTKSSDSQVEEAAISLPYYDSNLRFLLIVNKKDGVKYNLSNIIDIIEELSPLDEELDESYSKINIYLPKYKLESEYDLKQTLLKGTEMIKCSTDAIDSLQNIAPNLCVTESIHKAVLEINEFGTEAAAVTASSFASKRVSREKSFTFNPFTNTNMMYNNIVAIYHKDTKQIIFVGKIKTTTYFE